MKDIVLDWSERFILLNLFSLFAIANLSTNDPTNYLLVLLEAVGTFFILIRRRASTTSDQPLDWALALAGTMTPLLIRPGGEPIMGWSAAALIAVGTAIAFGAKVSLNRRFGMAPANRGVQAGWAYAIVRHPMYLGYIVAQSGYLLHNPTRWNAGVCTLAWGLQVARIWREERHLAEDSAYRAYATKTRFRLVPGLY